MSVTLDLSKLYNKCESKIKILSYKQGLNFYLPPTQWEPRRHKINQTTDILSSLSLLINSGLYVCDAKLVPRKGGMLTCPLFLNRAQSGQRWKTVGPSSWLFTTVLPIGSDRNSPGSR